MLLEAPEAAAGPESHVWQRSRNGAASQLWHLTHVHDGWCRLRNIGNWLFLDADATWRITNKAKGLVIDFVHSFTMSNEHVLVFPWNGNANQQWTPRLIPYLSDVYEIRDRSSSRALDLPSASLAAGLVPCLSDAVTETMAEPRANPVNEPRAESVAGSMAGSTAGSMVGPMAGSKAGARSRRWHLLHRGDGCYQIRNMHSGLVLEAIPGPAPRVSLAPHDPDAAGTQLWRLELDASPDSGCRIVSQPLGLALAAHGAPPSAASVQLIDLSKPSSGFIGLSWAFSVARLPEE